MSGDTGCGCNRNYNTDESVFAAWSAKAATAQAEGKRFRPYAGSSELILIDDEGDNDGDSQAGV